MNITLEMVDEVMKATECTYGVAKKALGETNGDVALAVEKIKSDKKTSQEEASETFEKKTTYTQDEKEEAKGSKTRYDKASIIDQLKALVNAGIVNQILFVRQDKIILDIPVLAGAVSAIVFLFPTVVAIGAALVAGCDIMLEMKDGKIYNFNEITQDKIKDLKEQYGSKKKQKPGDQKQQTYTYSKVYEDEDETEEADYETLDKEE